MFRSVSHFNLNVANLDRSLDFYTGLGFRLMDRMDVRFADLGIPLGIEARALRTAFLRLEGQGAEGPMLDLVEFVDPQPCGQPYGSLANAGLGRIAFWTGDIDAALAVVDAVGARRLGPTTAMIGPGGGRVRTVCLCDPDGIVLQLFGPDGKPA